MSYRRLRDLREDSDLSQEYLSKKLYMHRNTYARYERGEFKLPLNIAILIADFYGVSLDYLAGRSDKMK